MSQQFTPVKSDQGVFQGHSATLPDSNRSAFLMAARQITIPVNCNDPYQVLLEVAPEFEQYLEPLQPLLLQLTQPHGLPYIVLENMPIDPDLPSAPQDGHRPVDKKNWVSELTLLATAIATGLHPFNYHEGKGGALIDEIVPTQGKEQSLSNAGRVPLGFHTDNAILHRPYRPEYLALLGLKNLAQVPTYIALLDEALSELSHRHQQILREPLFRVEIPQYLNWFQGKVLQSEWRSLITTSASGENEAAGNLYGGIKAKNQAAQTAHDTLSDALACVARPVVLTPGSLLLFSNHRCFHARAAVVGERWLQRIYARQSLEQLRQATGIEGQIFPMSYLVLE